MTRDARDVDALLFVNACAGRHLRRPGARAARRRDARRRRPRRTSAVAVERRAASPRSGRERELRARYPRRERASTARGGVLTPGPRRLAHARDLRPRRATRSRSCAPPGSTTWRSRGAAAASTRPCATCARAARTSCSRSRVPRLRALASYGIDDRRGEVRLRPHARRRAQVAARDRAGSPSALPLRIVPTWLGAHEIPLEHRERAAAARDVHRPARPRDAPRGRRASGSRASPTCSASPASSPSTRAAQHSRRPRARRDSALKLHADELDAVRRRRAGRASSARRRPTISAAISRRGHRRARRGRHRRDAASRDDALPRQAEAGAGARAASTPAPRSRWRPISTPERRPRRTFRSFSRSASASCS